MKTKYIQSIQFKDKLVLIHLLTYELKILRNTDMESWIRNELSNIKEEVYNDLKRSYFIVENEDVDKELLRKAQKIFSLPYKPLPYSVCIYLTDLCDLQCTYCYSGYTREMKKGKITQGDVRDIFEAIKKLSKITNISPKDINIALIGGEPLLPQNVDIMQQILHESDKLDVKHLEIISNLLNVADFIDTFKTYGGRITFKATFNGNNDVHDSMRKKVDGSGTYFETFKNIRIILDELPTATIDISILIDKQSDNNVIKSLFKDFDNVGFLENQRINFKFGKIQFRGEYRGLGNYVDNVIPDEDYTVFLLDIYKNNQHINRDMIGGGPLYKLFDLYDNWTGNKLVYPSFKGCDAVYPGRYCFYVDGFIYPCTDIVGIEKYRIGTYKDGFLLNNEFFRWHNFDVKALTKCNSCRYVAFCNGGCLISSDYYNGNFNDVHCENIEKGIEKLVRYLDQERMLE